MRTVSNKTIEKYAKLIKGNKWTKQEINGFLKLLRGKRFVDQGTKGQIEHLMELFSEVSANKDYSITKEHSNQGLEWLKTRVLLKRGGVAKGSGFSHHDVDIIKDFDHFKFVGIHQYYNSYTNESTDFGPIFRIVAKDGSSIDYSPIRWSPALVDSELNPL